MTNKIAGLLVALALLVGFGAGVGMRSMAEPARPNSYSSGPEHHYEIVFSPHVRADTFILDTSTGQTWVEVAGKDGTNYWQHVAATP